MKKPKKAERIGREEGKYVVLYWVGEGGYYSPSVRSTGAYPIGFGWTEEKKITRLEELKQDLSKNGYNTTIVSADIGRLVLSTVYLRNPFQPKGRKPPRARKVEKRRRKPSRPIPYTPLIA